MDNLCFIPNWVFKTLLRHQSRMTFREIANALGIKEGTAKVRHYRLLEKFRTWLEKRHPEYLPLFKWGDGGE